MNEDRIWQAAVQILTGLARNPGVDPTVVEGGSLAETAFNTAKALETRFSERTVELNKEHVKDPRFPVILKILGMMLDEHERLRTSSKGKGWDYHQGSSDALLKAIECVGGVLNGKIESVDFMGTEPPPRPYKIEKLDKGIVKISLWGVVDWGSDKAHYDLLDRTVKSPGGIRFDLAGVQKISSEWVRFMAALATLCEKLGKRFSVTGAPGYYDDMVIQEGLQNILRAS